MSDGKTLICFGIGFYTIALFGAAVSGTPEGVEIGRRLSATILFAAGFVVLAIERHGKDRP